jgi:hypothetical protein
MFRWNVCPLVEHDLVADSVRRLVLFFIVSNIV